MRRPRLRFLQLVTRYVCFEAEAADEDGNPPESIYLTLGKRRLRCMRLEPGRTGSNSIRFRKLFRTGRGFKWISVRVVWADGTETVEARFLVLNVARRPPDPYARDYRYFLQRNQPTEGDWRDLDRSIQEMDDPPKFSIILPTYNTDPRLLREAIASVQAQTYPHWELCIADDASTRKATTRVLREMAEKDERIKVRFRPVNGHISAASNSALSLAEGEWIGLLDHDDLLVPQSLARMALEISRYPDARFVYSDEEKVDIRGQSLSPYFKPDWNPVFLFSQNYVCHFTCIRREDVEKIGGFRKGVDGSQDWDLFLRLWGVLRSDQIRHIPEVLYRWREIPGSSAVSVGEKSYSVEASRKALQDAVPWAREGDWSLVAGMYWLCEPPVCESWEKFTIPVKGSIPEIASQKEIMVFVPEDAEPTEELMNRIAGWASRSEMGMVAGALGRADGGIHEGGIVVEKSGKLHPIFRSLYPDFEGMGRREILPQCMAVPGLSFLAMRRELWERLDPLAFDYESWSHKIAHASLLLREEGLWNVFLPYLRLIGSFEDCQTELDAERFCQQWSSICKADPGMNPNLSIAGGFFGLEMDKQVRPCWRLES